MIQRRITIFGLLILLTVFSLQSATKIKKIALPIKTKTAALTEVATKKPKTTSADSQQSTKKISQIKTTSKIKSPTTTSKSTFLSPSAASPSLGSNTSIDGALADTIEQFFNVFPDPDNPQYALLPTLDRAVTTIYQDALHIPPILMNAIRRFYSFVQAQVFDEKLEKYQQAIVEIQSKVDIALQKRDPLASSLQKQLETVTKAYQEQIKALDKSIIRECTQSKFWQNHLRSFIASSFDYEHSLLAIIHKDEKEMFNLLPQFEIAYHTKDFTSLRIDAEIVRTFLILLELVRERLITQSLDWSKIETQEALYDAIATFMKTDQFKTQKAFTDATFSTKTYPLTNAKILTDQESITPGFKDFLEVSTNNGKMLVVPTQRVAKMITVDPKTMAISLTALGNLLLAYTPNSATQPEGLTYTPFFSQLFQETANGYQPTKLYMTFLGFSGIKLINSAMEYLFNTANLESTMAQLATLDPQLLATFPMINPYQSSDYLYLDDINYLKAGSATLDASTSTAQNQNQTNGNGAAAQSIFSKIKKAFKSAGKAIEKGAKTVGQGLETAGTGIADLSKITGNIISDNVVSMGNSIADAGKTFAKDIVPNFKDIGMDIVDGVKTAGNMFKDLGIAGYYDVGLGCWIENISYSEGQKKASIRMANSIRNLNNLIENASDLITDVGAVVKTTQKFTQTVVVNGGTVLAGPAGWLATAVMTMSGQKVRDEITSFIHSCIDATVDIVVLSAKITGLWISSAVLLPATTILFIAQTVCSLAGALGGDTSSIQNFGASFLHEMVVAMLRPVKLAFSGLMDGMKDLMMATAYLAGAIVDSVINIGGATAAIAAATYGGDPTTAFNNVKEKVNEHRRLITSVIGIVIVSAATIAATVLTGGSATCPILLGLTALFAGMMALESQGEHAKDMDTIKEKAEQVEFVEKFAQYVEDSEKTSQITQTLLNIDIALQYEDMVQNQERSLLFYQNYLNSNFNASIATAAYGVGNFYNQLFSSKNSAGIPYGDIGQNVGIQTNRFNLNPSQGLATYNTQRETFAQEIAVMPQQTITASQDVSLEINNGITKFWINQKDNSTITDPALAAEIRFRTLYESKGAFYIGIFLTNQVINKEALNALYKNFNDAQSVTGPRAASLQQKVWNNLNEANRHILDFNRNGKAFVVYRNAIQETPKLGLYEHSKNGWIAQDIAPTVYQTGVWQRMKMKIEKETIYVKCWAEHLPEPTNWQGSYPTTLDSRYIYPAPIDLSAGLTKPSTAKNLVVITPKDSQIFDEAQQQWIPYKAPQTNMVPTPTTGSMGVITSGAAVEYEVITPKQTIQKTAARTTSDQKIDATFAQANLEKYEIDRGKAANLQTTQLASLITFGSLTLAPVDINLIKQGIYLYTTNDTGLKDGNDYVVFALGTSKDSKTGLATATKLGAALSQKPPIIVSLVTGNAYDQNKTMVQTCFNVMSAYISATQLPSDMVQKITSRIATIRAQELAPITLNGITLTPELGAICNNSYIYSAPSTTSGLTGKDYFISAALTANGNLVSTYSYGQKFDPSSTAITGVISLVTGKAYSCTVNGTSIKTLTGQDLKKVALTLYKDTPGYTNLLMYYSNLIDVDLYTLIQKQAIAYTAGSFTQKPAQTQPVQPVIPPPSTVSLSSLQMPNASDTEAANNFNDLFDYTAGGF